MPGKVLVGVDVGGSKAHVVVRTDGTADREATVPSAAWYQVGLDAVAEGTAGMLTAEERSHLAALAVGAHGCDTREQCYYLERALRTLLDRPVVALNDAELVLPAAGVEPGVGVICGTGSIAIGYDGDGKFIAVGGWGGFLGDEGSGTGLFRDAARAATLAYDRRDTSDPLIAVLLELTGLSDLRDLPALLATKALPTSWSALAPLLIDTALQQGSALAASVLDESAGCLADLVVLLAHQGASIREAVAAGGVVAHAPWMRDALVRAFAGRCPATKLSFLEDEPVTGALRLARDFADLLDGRDLGEPPHPRLREALLAQPS